MNCLEFRTQMLAAPRALTTEMLAHRHTCAQCAAFAARVERLEAAVVEAVRIDPPEGLAHRILLRRSLADTPRLIAPARRRFFALAASITTASVGLGTWLFWRDNTRDEAVDDQLARELVAHQLMAHPPGLGAIVEVSETDVGGLLARASFASRASLGQVDNAWPCDFRQQPIAHLVLRGSAGKVTALLLPLKLAARTQAFSGPNLHGLIAPCAHGTLALLADVETDLDALTAHLQDIIVTA